jgi:acetyl esterase
MSAADQFAKVAARADGPLLRSVLRLSPGALRRIAGPPIVLDGQQLDVEMQAILRLERFQPRRTNVTIAAGRAVIDHQAKAAAGRQPVGAVTDAVVPGPAGDIPIRAYRPTAAGPSLPLLLFFHGGGFVYGGLESHDGLCRFLAEHARIAVVAVDYRLAPEHPFPAGLEDSWAAYRWIRADPGRFGADATRIAVGGDSAGGTIAAVLAQRGRDEGCPPAFQFLVYPSTDAVERRPSRDLFANGFWLSDELMEFFIDSYLPAGTDPADPRVSPLRAPTLRGLAPAHVLTAGFDPLRDEGEAYAQAMADAGVDVTVRREAGLIHTFANIVGVGRSGPAAMRRAAGVLGGALHR